MKDTKREYQRPELVVHDRIQAITAAIPVSCTINKVGAAADDVTPYINNLVGNTFCRSGS